LGRYKLLFVSAVKQPAQKLQGGLDEWLVAMSRDNGDHFSGVRRSLAGDHPRAR
jgi:hypothetical protein